MDGDGVGLKEFFEQEVSSFPKEKMMFIHSLRPSDYEIIESVGRTAYYLNHQEGAALENAIVEGKLRLRFEHCPSQAIEAALERWDGHRQRAASGLNQCIRDILMGVAMKAKNGKKED